MPALRGVAPPADPLAETLHLLRLTGTFYCRSELTAPWGLDLPPMDGCMMFHVVTAGQCWLQVDEEEPRFLSQGSMVLVPHGNGHRAFSDAQVIAKPLFDIPVEPVSERYEVLRYGGGGEATQITCGVVRFDHVAAQHLVTQLPKLLVIDATEQEDGGWLQSTLRFITREARELRPGSETVITRLADILVVQAIRSWIESAPEAEYGWLAGLRDDRIGVALAAIHRDPRRDWSVATLASEVGMSRSGFSARFTDIVGESVGRYLTKWRMNLAHAQLLDSSDPVITIAHDLAYQSEASFCRAFKREFGKSPGSVRRAGRPELVFS